MPRAAYPHPAIIVSVRDHTTSDPLITGLLLTKYSSERDGRVLLLTHPV